MLSPIANDRLGVRHTREPVQVQAILPELAVENFHERVLRRLSRLDEMQLHAGVSRPEEHGLACKLRPAIANQRLRQRSVQPFSRSRRRLASETAMPPNFAFQR